MNASEWEPTEQDIEWTRGYVAQLEDDATWTAGEMVYQKTGDAQLTLIQRTERAVEAHERVTKVLEAIEWDCITSEDLRIIPTDPQEQVEQAQETARQWVCPSEDCDTRLGTCDLDAVTWQSMGMQPAMMPDGTETEAERWLVVMPCAGCSDPLRMNPLDYALLAGDDLFHTFHTERVTYKVLSREQTIEMIDAGDAGLALGSRGVFGEAIPPHIQGAYCKVEEKTASDEEE
jgi:hypothetical protein